MRADAMTRRAWTLFALVCLGNPVRADGVAARPVR